MPKSFNVTGLCIPDKHYMANVTDKINKIISYIKKDQYFTINRARQYGKTTTLYLLEQQLRSDYLIINISFEGISEAAFATEAGFVQNFLISSGIRLRQNGVPEDICEKWEEGMDNSSIMKLNLKITSLLGSLDKEVILMIDEVDKSSNNQLFLDFLGMLRLKYLDREARKDISFKSVILVSVYDVKNLKLKLRPDSVHQYNSPWNIAADFTVDMELNRKEIRSMLSDYSQEHADVLIDIDRIADQIYEYSSGYPYLVSAICKITDEEILPAQNDKWNGETTRKAVKLLLQRENTLFDDLKKKLTDHKDLYELIYRIIVLGYTQVYSVMNDTINLGIRFGILTINEKKQRLVQVSNIIFETLIYDFIMARDVESRIHESYKERTPYISDTGELRMDVVLQKFADFMYEEYRKSDAGFLEKQGRLLFLAFLKPIINGIGHYAVEAQTRSNIRMDIVIFYGGKKYIVELKLWHGSKKEKESYEQLLKYMDAQKQQEGYLIHFQSNIKQREKIRKILIGESTIYEVLV